MSTARSAAVLAASVLTASVASAQGRLILDEPLKGSAPKAVRASGGSFLPDGGWKITGMRDHILWHIPTLTQGALEFSVRGLSPRECRAGMGGKNEIFHMYDWKAGNADDVYAPPDGGPTGYRNNRFKHFIRKTGCLDTRPGKTDSLELMWKIADHADEPDTRALSWDPGVTYRFREEWGPDGAGNCELKVFRDGALVYTLRQPGEWRPEGHSVRIGASNRRAKDEEAPIDAVFSAVKVWDLNASSEAPAPAPPAPAAAQPEVRTSDSSSAPAPPGARKGPVRVVDHALADDGGPFLGLGFSYFTALHRAKFDRQRLHGDLAFMAERGFNFYRMFSTLGWYEAWKGVEIAPVAFTNRARQPVAAWPDYWEQFRELIDLAYDRYGLRAEITIFADAQLIPDKASRIAHMDRILKEVLPGRRHKVILLEVANEAWQNGFPDPGGTADLREFARYLADRTSIPVAITSNHDGDMAALYQGSAADIATWHFSRDLSVNNGWGPVQDCWRVENIPNFPPACSNEPIGPGSTVAAQNDPIKLVVAAAYAYTAKLPMFVFHGRAGRGTEPFQQMPAVGDFRRLPAILPPDLPNWTRNDGKGNDAPFALVSGAVENVGSRKGDAFVCVPIGVAEGGVVLEAREALSVKAVHPITGETAAEKALGKGERLTLPRGPGAYILVGKRR